MQYIIRTARLGPGEHRECSHCNWEMIQEDTVYWLSGTHAAFCSHRHAHVWRAARCLDKEAS